MNRTDDVTLSRIPLYSLGLSIVMLVLAAVAERISTPSEPCQQELPLGVPHLSGVSTTAIMLGWIGVISSVTALVSAVVRTVLWLRDPKGETRWAASGQVLFLVFPVALLLANAFPLEWFYSLAAGRLVDCT